VEEIKVFVLSQQSLFLRGIEQELSLFEGIEISGATAIDGDMLSAMDNLPPDVAVIDIDSVAGGGLTITRQLKQRLPNVGIIALTSNDNDIQIFEAIKAQVSACLSKESTGAELFDSIRKVARGEHPINDSLVTHPILADQVLRQFQVLSQHNETQNFVSPLTPRETEILDNISQGKLNKQIAVHLGISEQTIKNHVTSILRKLNANARTEAVILGLRQGLISIH
jgi:DNA-binding NarL/FixJ family response regulator